MGTVAVAIAMSGWCAGAALAQETAAQDGAPATETAAPADAATAGAEPEAGEDEAGDGEAVEDAGDPDAPPAEGDPENVDPAGNEDAEADEDAVAEAAGDWGRFQPLADLIEAGGAIIVILAVLSVLSLAIIVLKLVQFSALRVGDRGVIDHAARLPHRGDRDGALDGASKRRGVIARVLETALRGRALGLDEAHVREEVERVAHVKLDGLERGLPLLSLIATISPLLGLLGTVLGMIEAFQQLENAGDRVDPAILSGGIWEALLTTAAGLSVAIPAASFFTWLQRAVDVAGQHMENAATRAFTADLYAGRRTPATPEDSED